MQLRASVAGDLFPTGRRRTRTRLHAGCMQAGIQSSFITSATFARQESTPTTGPQRQVPTAAIDLRGAVKHGHGRKRTPLKVPIPLAAPAGSACMSGSTPHGWYPMQPACRCMCGTQPACCARSQGPAPVTLLVAAGEAPCVGGPGPRAGCSSCAFAAAHIAPAGASA